MRVLSPVLFYVSYVLAWTAGLSALGAALGAVLVPLFGRVLGSGKTLAELVAIGAENGAFLFFIWAPGIGIVLAFRRAYLRRHPAAAASSIRR